MTRHHDPRRCKSCIRASSCRPIRNSPLVSPGSTDEFRRHRCTPRLPPISCPGTTSRYKPKCHPCTCKYCSHPPSYPHCGRSQLALGRASWCKPMHHCCTYKSCNPPFWCLHLDIPLVWGTASLCKPIHHCYMCKNCNLPS